MPQRPPATLRPGTVLQDPAESSAIEADLRHQPQREIGRASSLTGSCARLCLPGVLASGGGTKRGIALGREVQADNAISARAVAAFAFATWIVLATAMGRSFTAMGLAGNDAHLFAYIGQKWFAGRLPYRDVWDNKPPGIFLATALAFSASTRGFAVLAVVEGLLILGTIATVHAILRRLGAPRRVAFVAIALCTIMANLRYYNEGGTLTEVYVILPASLSILSFLAARGPLATDTASPLRIAGLALAAGVFGGVATTFKLVGAACLLAETGVLALGWALGRYRWSRVMLTLGGVATGFCLAWAPWLIYFHAKGQAGAMLWASFVAPVRYGADSQPHLLHLPIMLAERFAPVAGATATVLAGVATWGLAVRPILRGHGTLRTRAGELWVNGRVALLCLWLLFDLLAVLAGGRGYPHYFLALSSSLSVAAALAYWRLVERPLAASQGDASVQALVIALICSSALCGQVSDAHEFGMAVRSPPTDDAVARYVGLHARRGETLFSWPYHPQLFFATGLDSPHRLTSAENLRDSSRMRAIVEEDLLHTLEVNSPGFLVDGTDNARARVDEASPLAPAHARFQRLLAAKYDLALASGDTRLYRLRP